MSLDIGTAAVCAREQAASIPQLPLPHLLLKPPTIFSFDCRLRWMRFRKPRAPKLSGGILGATSHTCRSNLRWLWHWRCAASAD